MLRFLGLFVSSLIFLGAGVLFFFLASGGLYFERATPVTDLGLYAVTVILLGFGGAGLLLRWAKIHAPQAP